MSGISRQINQFEDKLTKSKLSSTTLRNYLSDTGHFKKWAQENSIESLNKQSILEYISFLKLNNISDSSINRKLSTLRRLEKFLNQNFMNSIKNAGVTNKFTSTIDEYKQDRLRLNNSYIGVFVIMFVVAMATNYLVARQIGVPMSDHEAISWENKFTGSAKELRFIPKDSISNSQTMVAKAAEVPSSDVDLTFRLSADPTSNNQAYYADRVGVSNNVTYSVSGSVLLPSGSKDIVVYHPAIRPDSIIILTPRSSTGNNVLYTGLVDTGRFMINSDNSVPSNVVVDWIAN